MAAKRYGDKEKERGLMELALANGNSREAARNLAADTGSGFKVSPKTLERWKTTERDRFLELRQDVLQKVRAHAAAESMKAATNHRELADEMVEELRKKYPEMEARYLGSAILQQVTAYGIHVDKAEKLSDQTAVVIEHRKAGDVLRRLQARGVVIDLEAEEIPPEGLPESEDD